MRKIFANANISSLEGFKAPVFIVLFSLLFAAGSEVHAQMMNRVQGGSARDFKITVNNSFGVRTMAEATPNVVVDNQATLNIMRKSELSDGVNNPRGSFVATPTGGSINITGVRSENKYIIDSGTSFSSSMKSVPNPDPNTLIKGNASSMGVHELSIQIQSQQSSFGSSFSQNF